MAERAGQMQYCTRCGSPSGSGQFCVRCGAQLPVAGEEITRVPGRPALLTAPPGPAAPRRRGAGLGLALAVLAVVCLSVGGGLFLLTLDRADDAGQDSVAGATHPASAPPTLEAGPSASPSDAAGPISPEPAPTITVTQTAPPPTELTDCGDGAFAAGTASCPFAITVAAAYRASGGSGTLTDVYSPVTELYYDLTCTGTAPAECRVGRARILIY